MGKLATWAMFFTAFVSMQFAAGKVILEEGGTYEQGCPLTLSGNSNQMIQFVKEKTVIKMFNSEYTIPGHLISNDTEVDTAITNATNRYTVYKASGGSGDLVLRITGARPSDSGQYLCRAYNVDSDTAVITLESKELLVRGPLRDLYWTRNHTRLNNDRSFEVPDNGTVLEPNPWYGPLTSCAVLVSNVEPEVNITIGKPGEEGTEDVTDQFETRQATVTSDDDVGVSFKATVFFVKKSQFGQASIRNLYCRAIQPGSETLNRSVNLQIITKPPLNRRCEPYEVKAPVGSNNVTLQCLIPAHPAPEVTWEIRQKGTSVNESSDNPMFSVANQYMFEGLLTTLTISKVKADTYGTYYIQATNSEGSGTMYTKFTEGRSSGARMKNPSLGLMLLLGLLSKWMLKA